MKLRLKGESEWKDYILHFNNDGSFRGVAFDEVKVQHQIPTMNGKNEMIEVSGPILLPLECFDMWEEPNWQSIRTQAAIGAMQGILSGSSQLPFDKKSVAQYAVLMADFLIEELQQTQA